MPRISTHLITYKIFIKNNMMSSHNCKMTILADFHLLYASSSNKTFKFFSQDTTIVLCDYFFWHDFFWNVNTQCQMLLLNFCFPNHSFVGAAA